MNIFDIRSNKSKNKNASKGLEFDYSDPNIAYLGGGGGSTTTGGGTVVQSTDPVAAELAGTMQANAANTAAQDYNASIQEAIKAINNQYNQAQYAVQPYQQTGVAALDQLNQYLGLPSYNPGNAPTDPHSWNPSETDIRNYVRANSYMGLEGEDQTPYTIYNGIGARPTPGASQVVGYLGGSAGANSNTHLGPGNGPGRLRPGALDIIGVGGGINLKGVGNVPQGQYAGMELGGSLAPSQLNQITNLLKQQYVDNNIDQYNTNLSNFNVNKGLYDKYSAEGPLSSQQITDKIINLPGYQAQLGQGIAAIGGDASAKEYLGSGKILKELSNYGQGTFSQFYGQELSRLSNLVGQGANTAASLSQSHQNQGNSLAQLYDSLGQNTANSALAGTNALAQGIINANQNFNVLGQTTQTTQGDSGLSGIGSLLGGIGSLASSFGL